MAIQVAVPQGLEVYVLTRSQGHGRLAEDLDAVWTGTPDQAPPKSLGAAIRIHIHVRTFPLNRANEASLVALKQSRIDGAGVLVPWRLGRTLNATSSREEKRGRRTGDVVYFVNFPPKVNKVNNVP